jgi:hypothetical protein
VGEWGLHSLDRQAHLGSRLDVSGHREQARCLEVDHREQWGVLALEERPRPNSQAEDHRERWGELVLLGMARCLEDCRWVESVCQEGELWGEWVRHSRWV